MAKEKKAKIKGKVDSGLKGRVVQENITAFGRRALKLYADEVNLERATPDLIDGLKPVSRRIVYGTSEVAKSQFAKSAQIVGHVMGTYHPHGDCLDGDTLVYTLDGKFTKIKDMLTKGRKWVLAYDPETKKFVPAMAHSWRIGQHAHTTYELHLSDGSIVKATGNHPFFEVTTEDWVKVQDLVPNDELIGADLCTSGTYLNLRWANDNKLVHRVVGEAVHGVPESDELFHHINEIKWDNRPKNLEIIDRATHAIEHGDNYERGLENGRKTMFEGTGKMRKAIAKKNSTLMSINNEWLWLTKAIKVAKIALDRYDELNEEAYNAARGAVYNATKWETLAGRGVTAKKLKNYVDTNWRPDFSAAKGHTRKLKREPAEREYSNDGIKHSRLPAFMDVVRYMKDRCLLAAATWEDYSKARASLIKVHAKTNGSIRVHAVEDATVRAYTSPTVAWLRSNIAKTFTECLKFASPRHGLFVLKVVARTSSKAKPMYDFTVDGFENMLIAVPRGDSHTLVVAHNSSIYGAMVTMVNATTPLLHGKGGWGTLLDNAAAMRYTNARLSAFGRLAFDVDYMNKEVTTFVPNYDDRTSEPVSVPFPLPVILFSGDSGIGYGSACDIPSFTPESVVEVLKKLLQGEKMKALDFAKIMKPVYKWGGEFVNTKANREAWAQMFVSSKASVQFQAPLHLDQAKRQIMINEWPDGLDPEKFVAWTREQSEVQQVYPSKGTTEFTILMKKGYNSVQWDAFIKKVQKKTQVKSSFNINVTQRTATINDGVVDYDVKMMSLSVPQLVIAWLRARLDIETRALAYRIKKQEEAIAYSKLLIFAASKLDIIVPIIRKSKAPREDLMKKLKLTREQANQILELKLRQLTRLDQDEIDAKRKEQVKHLDQLQKWLAKPKKKVLMDVESAMEAILADRKYIASKDKQELTLEA